MASTAEAGIQQAHVLKTFADALTIALDAINDGEHCGSCIEKHWLLEFEAGKYSYQIMLLGPTLGRNDLHDCLKLARGLGLSVRGEDFHKSTRILIAGALRKLQ